MGRTWGRLYLGTRNHRKIKTLRRRHPASWKAFYVLLEMALETDDDGWIYLGPGQPYPLDELADEVDETPEALQSLLNTMADLGLIQVNGQGIQFLSYSDRQYRSDADGTTGRMERYRAQKSSKRNQSVSSITEALRDGYAAVTPDTETETETELSTSPSGEVVAGPASPSADPTPSEPVLEAEEMLNGGNGDAPPKQKFGPASLVELWNGLGCRPMVSELTDERRKKAGLRIRKRGDPDWWRRLFEKARDLNKPWLTFDFLTRNDTNCLKVLEGAYDHDFRERKPEMPEWKKQLLRDGSIKH